MEYDRDFWQQDFDMTIGRLDRILSKMVGWGRDVKNYNRPLDDENSTSICPVDNANQQTLKHHAEDMILAGQKILKDLGYPPLQAARPEDTLLCICKSKLIPDPACPLHCTGARQCTCVSNGIGKPPYDHHCPAHGDCGQCGG